MTGRSSTSAGPTGRSRAALLAGLAAALLGAACPQIDFEGHSFTCASDTDCLFLQGEECLDGFCRNCEKGQCQALDAGAPRPDAGANCTAGDACPQGTFCMIAATEARCVAPCENGSSCGSLSCKPVRTPGGQYATACMDSGPVEAKGGCGSSADCVATASCFEAVCFETCSPTHAQCSTPGQLCDFAQAGAPPGWGWCK